MDSTADFGGAVLLPFLFILVYTQKENMYTVQCVPCVVRGSGCVPYVFHRFYRFYVQLHAASSVAAANTLFSLLWVELFT